MSIKPELTVCMIAKNEEAWIGRCLASIQPYADEIIVVDTGSQDRTADIVRAMGGHVYSFDWSESFADARNYGLQYANGEWILWLDADEEANAENIGWLNELHRYESSNILAVEMIHFNSPMYPDPDSAYRMIHHRLFRNRRGFRFEGRIHEQLCNPLLDMKMEVEKCQVLPLTLLHYGYLQSVTDTKNKFTRNFNLLEKQLSGTDEPDPWLLYHMASEYYRQQNYTLAFNQVNWAISAALARGILPPALYYKLKYAALLETGNYEGAWPGIDKVLLLYPDYVDLHFYKGCILLQLGKAEMAIQAFEECLRLGDTHPQYMTLQGAGTFYAQYYLGLCHAKLEEWEKAAHMYIMALELSPHFAPARQELERLKVPKHKISCFVVSEPVGPHQTESYPLPSKSPSVSVSSLWTIGAVLGPNETDLTQLRRWLEEWDAFADEWVIADCGMSPEARRLVTQYAHQLIPCGDNGMDAGELVRVLREKASCDYFLWLNPVEWFERGDAEELVALRQQLIAQDSRNIQGVSFKLIWPNQTSVGTAAWIVRRNRMVKKTTAAYWNTSLEEFIMPPGASLHESGCRLRFNRCMQRMDI